MCGRTLCESCARLPPTHNIPHPRAGMCGRTLCESCARLPPYCSILIVKYDISCGRQSSKALVMECVLGGYALPGPVGDSLKGSSRTFKEDGACRGLTSVLNC